MTVQDQLRLLPGVDVLLRSTGILGLVEAHGHDLTVEALRATLDQVRAAILAGAPCPPEREIVAQSAQQLESLIEPSLRPVINDPHQLGPSAAL